MSTKARIMSENTRWWGSVTLLSGLGATLFSALVLWLFATTLKNYVEFKPLNDNIVRLAETIENVEKRNQAKFKEANLEHKATMATLNTITAKLTRHEVKLFRVIEDCDENAEDLKLCGHVRMYKKTNGEHR